MDHKVIDEIIYSKAFIADQKVKRIMALCDETGVCSPQFPRRTFEFLFKDFKDVRNW